MAAVGPPRDFGSRILSIAVHFNETIGIESFYRRCMIERRLLYWTIKLELRVAM